MATFTSADEVRLPQVIDAFAPLLGQPRYLRLAHYHRHGAEQFSYLHVFDRTDAPSAAGDVPPELQPAFSSVLAELRGDAPVPALRPAWARPGWQDDAEDWVGSALSLIRSWPLSAVLRGQRDGEPIYMKASFPLFQHEPALTAALAHDSPGLVPDVLATDRTRGWLLMREIPGVPAYDRPGREWDSALRAIGRVQRAWIGRGAELVSLGAPDRSLATLDDEVRDHPSLRRCLDELAAFDLDATVGHGDFHIGNVNIDDDGGAVVFDWSDACVCHPLFDLALFLQGVREDGVRSQLVSAWADGYGLPFNEVERALPLADVLTCVHQGVSYRSIAANVEPGDTFGFTTEPQRWLEAALGKAERPG